MPVALDGDDERRHEGLCGEEVAFLIGDELHGDSRIVKDMHDGALNRVRTEWTGCDGARDREHRLCVAIDPVAVQAVCPGQHELSPTPPGQVFAHAPPLEARTVHSNVTTCGDVLLCNVRALYGVGVW